MAHKKKYHQSKRDRMHERRGEDRYLEHAHRGGFDDEMFSTQAGGSNVMRDRYSKEGMGMYPSKSERKDKYDHTDVSRDKPRTRWHANMPPHSIVKEMENPYFGADFNYNDTVSGIDGQIESDHNTMRREYRPRKI